MIRRMRSITLALALLACTGCTEFDRPGWQGTLDYELPLLGHRNWIVIVDSAYPAQSSAGIEMLYIGGTQLEAVRRVLQSLDRAAHVRPIAYYDAELDDLRESDASGITRYRRALKELLALHRPRPLPHDELIATLDDTSQRFRVLVLKTDETLPYTSVFLELDCGYWSPAAELRLRKRQQPKQSEK